LIDQRRHRQSAEPVAPCKARTSVGMSFQQLNQRDPGTVSLPETYAHASFYFQQVRSEWFSRNRRIRCDRSAYVGERTQSAGSEARARKHAGE
jgi:hypothetical protein